MKNYLIALALLTGACSSNTATGPSVTLPAARATAAASASRTSSFNTKAVTAPPDATVNCDPPSLGSVDFDQTQFGRVFIRNTSRCTNSFLFVIWDAANYDDQTIVSYIDRTLAPGASAELTLGIPNPTCTKYQRDVYFGITEPTADRMHNFQPVNFMPEGSINVFYANGDPTLQPGGVCTPGTPSIPPPPPPPPATCQNREANNYGGLLPCTFGEGVIVVDDPPPSVVDLCPNVEGIQLTLPCTVAPPPPPQTFLFCHVAVNVTGGKNPKTIVHETQVGGLNGIPLSAIVNGHTVGNPGGGVTTEHLYDYYGVCDGRGIGGQQ